MTRSVLLVGLVLISAQALCQSSKWSFNLKPGIGWPGTDQTKILDSETTDDFGRGFSFASGLRVGFRLSKNFKIAADPEWQIVQDSRMRTFNVMGRADPLVYKTSYRNNFQRVQLPLSLQFSPFPKLAGAYIMGGIMPSTILSGRINYIQRSSRDGEIGSESLKADFTIPGNKGLRNDLVGIAGGGFMITRRVSLEVVYQFNKPMQYDASDPGLSFINVPVYEIRNNQGLMIYVLIKPY
jgi:hypothetical protein